MRRYSDGCFFVCSRAENLPQFANGLSGWVVPDLNSELGWVARIIRGVHVPSLGRLAMKSKVRETRAWIMRTFIGVCGCDHPQEQRGRSLNESNRELQQGTAALVTDPSGTLRSIL